ncbi:hypothetical protein KO528_10500 [Saccharophagus degradans]|uniref:hypothetical protein n=1 Tax=Saccharophagus degradans TaxID=86304 RepID=UPI001C0A655C|nr:hypothetical protein [Saccharophagus degradans]MBU2985780.1 hypothetical protein [Saccharophagus degradans]
MLLNSLKLRNIKEPCQLVGPSIHQSKKISFNIDDSLVCIQLPRNRTSLKHSSFKNPQRNYQIEGQIFDSSISSKDGWGSLVCAARTWDFYGPLFSGQMGTISMVAMINSPSDIKRELSFFHPRAFEQTLGDYLTYLHGDEVYLNKQQWLAPFNWQPNERFDSVCANFEVVSATGGNSAERWLATPVTNSHLLSICFRLSWNHVDVDSISTTPNNQKTHDISGMEQLCDDIMNSLKVKLSDKALAQQKAALEGLDDRSLVKEYPPLKWEGPKEVI